MSTIDGPHSNHSTEGVEIEKVKTTRTDFNYFCEAINSNNKDSFRKKHGSNENRDEMLEADYVYFTSYLDMYKETVSKEYPDFEDFDFMKNCIHKIYSALYTDSKLSDIFSSDELKNKFFNLMKKYFFGNFGKMSLELSEKYSVEQIEESSSVITNNHVLSEDEISRLISSDDGSK